VIYKETEGRIVIKIGDLFGHWTVLAKVRSKNERVWLCKCSCGNTTKLMRATILRRCGRCLSCSSRNQVKIDYSLIGKTFGGYIVRGRIPIESRSSPNASWLCECLTCGFEIGITVSRLKRNKYGCQRCSAKINGLEYRLRPYESLWRHACRSTMSTTRGKRRKFCSYEAFLAIIATGRCHYCHVPLEWGEYDIGTGHGKMAYKVDRVDNAKGYDDKDNVVACCWRCNQAKSSRYSYDEWYRMTAPLRQAQATKAA
jgi:hypothetical protein